MQLLTYRFIEVYKMIVHRLPYASRKLNKRVKLFFFVFTSKTKNA